MSNSRQSSPSLKEIAECAGCSRMSVSRVLRSDARVSGKLRARVEAVLEELDYRPDPDVVRRMQTLRETRRKRGPHTIAVVSMMRARRYEHGPGSSRKLIWKGIGAEAESLGYRVEEFFPLIDRIAPERMRQILIARGIRLIVFSSSEQAGVRYDVDLEGLFAVTFGLTLEAPAVLHVAPNDHQHSYLGVHQLWRNGFRRIGLIHDAWELSRSYSNHLTGYLSALRRLEGLEALPEFDLRKGQSAFTEWFLANRPEAIVGRANGYAFFKALPVKARRAAVYAPMKNAEELPDFQGPHINTHMEAVGRATIATVHSLYLGNRSGLPQNPRSLLIDGTWEGGAGG